jgi:hypothetical protein
MRIASLAGLLVFVAATAPFGAHAEPASPLVACGGSQLEVVLPKGGDAAELRAKLVTPKGPWQFTAKVGMARAGKRTRTIAADEPRAEKGGGAGYAVMPTQLFIDLFVDDKKLALRHASEGGADPEIVLDFTGCKAGADLDKVFAKLVEPPEDAGCGPAVLKAKYQPQLAPLKLPAAEVEREAKALCEEHQKALAARIRLEQRLSDQAAGKRVAARGVAIGRTEEARFKAWEAVDACLARAAPGAPPTVAKLKAAEDKARACYDATAPDK